MHAPACCLEKVGVANRGNQAEPGILLELKIRNWESKEIKMARVCRVEDQREESLTNRGRSLEPAQGHSQV